MKEIAVKCRGAEYKSIDTLLDLQGGLKKLNKTNLDKLKQAILKHGFIAPVFIWENKGKSYVLDGNQRIKALCSLREKGYKIPELPVDFIMAENRKEAKEKLLHITSQYGDFDKKGLDEFILTANLDISDLDTIRLTKTELNITFIQEEKKTEGDDDINEEVPALTEPGDLWELGNHRLLCGDSTSPDDVIKLMNNRKARMTVTSPPYENQREYSQFQNYTEYLDFIDRIIPVIKSVALKNFICVWNIGSSEPTHNFIPADNYQQFRKAGFTWIEWIVWKKPGGNFSIPRSQHIENGIYIPALCWESITVYLLGNRPHFEIEDKAEIRENWQFNCWEMNQVIGSIQQKIGHNALFPIELPYRAVKSYSKKNEIIFDPFCGGGTTLIACNKAERICYGMEILPHYCDVIVKRYACWCEKNGRDIEIKLNNKPFDISTLKNREKTA
ncbi:MAG: DNA modification methylase [Spirochaetales bacterium]|nr:DNA modification methylase [Spirochaetales bacterium]